MGDSCGDGRGERAGLWLTNGFEGAALILSLGGGGARDLEGRSLFCLNNLKRKAKKAVTSIYTTLPAIFQPSSSHLRALCWGTSCCKNSPTGRYLILTEIHQTFIEAKLTSQV